MGCLRSLRARWRLMGKLGAGAARLKTQSARSWPLQHNLRRRLLPPLDVALHCYCPRIDDALGRIRRRKLPIVICLDSAPYAIRTAPRPISPKIRLGQSSNTTRGRRFRDGDGWRYVGHVGTGFSYSALDELYGSASWRISLNRCAVDRHGRAAGEFPDSFLRLSP